MLIFRTEKDVDLEPVATKEGGNWRRVSGRLHVPPGGLVLTDISEKESDLLQDRLQDIEQDYDPLRGILASLHVIGQAMPDDPPEIGLVSLPSRGQVVSHRDQHYLVTLVCQTSEYRVSVFAKRLTLEEFWALSDSAPL